MPNGFFTAPDLDEVKKEPASPRAERAGASDHTDFSQGQHGQNFQKEGNVPDELSDELRRDLSSRLQNHSTQTITKNIIIDNPKDRVIVRFFAPKKQISRDVDVPLDITANDLVVGLNQAYQLGIDVSDMQQCYFCCENPIALLKGKRLLGEFGVRDGSRIIFDH